MELYLCRVDGEENRHNNNEQWIRFPIKFNHEVKLGRSSDLPIRLLSPHVSRIHAVLKKTENGNFHIKDHGSLNGIHVNGIKVKKLSWHSLHADDQVEIGRPDDEEILKTMSNVDRFIYNVLSATSTDLDIKPCGPKLHMSELIKKMVKPRPTKTRDQKLNQQQINTNENNKSIKNKPNCVKSGVKNTDISKSKVSKVLIVDLINNENQIAKNNNLIDLTQTKKHKNDVGSSACRSEVDNHEVERENKRLKMELEQKEQALKEEIDLRNKKLEDEQKKIAAQLEENYKTKLEQKEEELEMRLQLEKDIALEQCKASMEKDNEPSAAIKTVVDTMENELQCAICAELFITSTTLNCAHTFCEYCINEWKSMKSVCPVCRQPIITLTRSLVLDNYISKALEGLSPALKDNREKIIGEREKIQLEAQKRKNTNRGRGRNARGGRGRARGRYNSSRGAGSGTSYQGSGRGNSLYQTRSNNVVVISDRESSDTDDSHHYQYHGSSDSDTSYSSDNDGYDGPYDLRIRF